MGIKSKSNWSGTIVDGVTLGEPAPDNPVYDAEGVMISFDGYHWDGGVPNGEIDPVGDFQPDGFLEDGVTKPPKEDFITKEGVVPKPPKMNETGEPDPTVLYKKEDLVTVDGVTYRCNKDGIPFDLALKDWAPLKGVK